MSNETMSLYIESICGGDDAAGRGCGSPLGVRRVSLLTFLRNQGVVYQKAQEHNEDEWDEPTHSYYLKLRFRPCSGCRVL